MKIENFTRRPFEVNAVQVTPQNAEEIAEWCGGKVGTIEYKLAGFKTPLNMVLVPGNGPKSGQMVEARIGSWVVERQRNFRVYRKKQFEDAFVKGGEKSSGYFSPGDLVQENDETIGIWQGRVVYVDQVLVEYPLRGQVLHNVSELKKISKYSEQTEKKWFEAAQANAGVPFTQALDALREQEEARVAAGDLTIHETISQAFEASQPAVTQIVHQLTIGTSVIVSEELNAFFSQTGEVVELCDDGVAVMIKLDFSDLELPEEPVKMLHHEVQALSEAQWVSIINPISSQNGWMGWVVKKPGVGCPELVRVAFRSTTLGEPDKCFSYQMEELEFKASPITVPMYDMSV